MVNISGGLWARSNGWVYAAAVHPFVLSLLRGVLNESAFKSYIAQDAFFLRSFRRAYDRAAALCAETNDSFGQTKFLELSQGVQDELNLHEKYSFELSIDLINVKPLPQTVLYTDFLEDSSKKSVAHICASMAPCMSLYAFIATRGVMHGYRENNYSSWLKSYSSVEFKALSFSIESLLDHYAKVESLDERALYPTYNQAMKLELGFFSALETRSWNGIKPSMIFIDFDKTITKVDTVTPFIRKSLEAQNRSLNDLKVLENNYLNKFNQFLDDNLPQTESPKYDKQRCDLFLTKLTEFDKSMIATVEENKAVAGLTNEMLRDLGKDVALLPGSDHLLNFMLRRHAVNIVSLNWSSQLIRSSLERVHCQVPHQRSPTVYANDLIMGSEGRSSGMITRLVNGANDKLDLMRRLIDQGAKGEEASSSSSAAATAAAAGPTVFIGDSLGDLAALLGADLGIIVGSSSSIARAASALGIVLKPVDDIVRCTFSPEPDYFHFPPLPATATTTTTTPSPPSLYVAESWSHLGFCMYGKHFYSEWVSLNSGNRYFPFDKDAKTAEALVIPRVLSVAGSDSGGGAGIQADLKTVGALGSFGMTAITAITAQNTRGVRAVAALDTSMVQAQLHCVLEDLGVDAVKTGMVPSSALAFETIMALTKFAAPNIVVDPVMVASSGDRLMSPEDTVHIRKYLFPSALVVTPNLDEAKVLLNLDYDIHTVEEMENAARALFELGPGYVLIKGGHMILDANRTQITSSKTVVDVLYDGISFERLENPVIKTRNTHGTGCTLAAAIAAHLAQGMDVPSAIRGARAYLQEVLERSANSALGSGGHGPMLHLPLQECSLQR